MDEKKKKKGKRKRRAVEITEGVSQVPLEDALSVAIDLHQLGRLYEAESVYRDILRVRPEQPDALHFLGVLNHQLGRSQDGVDYIKKSLELVPDQPGAINNLGNINKELGRLGAAEEAYRRVLELVPDHPDALCNLGVILRDTKRTEEALAALEKSIEIVPDHADAYHNLGNVYRDLDREEDALAAYRKSVELKPEQADAPKAIASLLFKSGKKDQAIKTLKDWLIRRPDDATARHLLAAYSGEGVPGRADDAYVRETFDKFAGSFDFVLKNLEYKAPFLVAERLKEIAGDTDRRFRILDIGCGTGLCGPLIKPLAETLVGVDLSTRMLGRAEERGVYDRLVEAELTEFMQKETETYDFIVCVDTFVYFGDLADAVRAARGRLSPGGRLVFTVEVHSAENHPEDAFLQPHGRYSHSREYISEVIGIAGLDVGSLDDVVLRREGDKPVGGVLATARKPQPE